MLITCFHADYTRARHEDARLPGDRQLQIDEGLELRVGELRQAEEVEGRRLRGRALPRRDGVELHLGHRRLLLTGGRDYRAGP